MSKESVNMCADKPIPAGDNGPICPGWRQNARTATGSIFLAILVFWAQTADAQETVVLEGRVRDVRTSQPLSDVTITLLDKGAEARTSRWGVYRLVCDTSEDVNVRLVLPGYATSVERVALRGGRTIADFRMTPVDAILEALHVTEPGPETNESEGGLAVRTVNTEGGFSPDANDVLKDVPGVLIMQPSGQVGSGKRIQLRGIRSLFAGSDPLVFVDGVRAMNFTSRVPWVRAESPLDYIPASNIDRIEIFKGPAASARYGTGALPGVIHIYTKKGPNRKPE